MSLILECKNVHRHKERNKVLNSLASQRGNMKTTHLSIYTLRDLQLQGQGMVNSHSQEEVSLPLISLWRPASLWKGGLVLSTQAHVPLLCVPVTLPTNGSISKNANILPGES